MNDNKWTIYIKSIRLASRYSLRAAAKQLNVSAPYLHDVETGNRAPTKKLVNSIINLYNLDNEEKRIIFDAAAEATDSIPYDVEDFLKENPDAIQTVINMMNENNNQLQKIKR